MSFSTWQLVGVAALFILAVVEYFVLRSGWRLRTLETRHAGPDALPRDQVRDGLPRHPGSSCVPARGLRRCSVTASAAWCEA